MTGLPENREDETTISGTHHIEFKEGDDLSHICWKIYLISCYNTELNCELYRWSDMIQSCQEIIKFGQISKTTENIINVPEPKYWL